MGSGGLGIRRKPVTKGQGAGHDYSNGLKSTHESAWALEVAMKYVTNRYSRRSQDDSNERSKQVAVQGLWEALLMERYEACPDLIIEAKRKGARSAEISDVIDQFTDSR